MSEDTYKGESLQKKYARFLVHDAARAWQDRYYPGIFQRGLHAVLASREGGDIGVLHGLGVPFDNIVALDRCDEALKGCARKWEAVDSGPDSGPHFIRCDEADVELAGINACLEEIRHSTRLHRMSDGSVTVGCVEERETGSCWTKRWAARSGHPHIATVFWDFCAHIERNVVQASIDSWLRCSVGSVFSVAVLKGREKAQPLMRLAHVPVGNRRARRAMKSIRPVTALITEMIRGVRPWDMNAALRALREQDAALDDPGAARWMFWMTVLLTADVETRPEPLATFEYQSTTADSSGVPMLVASFAKRWRHDPRGAELAPRVFTRITNADALQWRNRVLLERTLDDACLLLNLTRGSAAALKAHAARGTYDEAAE